MVLINLAYAVLFSLAGATTVIGDIGERWTFGDKENGSRVTISEDDIVIVRLASRPGTGYGWRLMKNETRRLKFLGETTETSEGGRDGGTQFQVFRFKADSEGTTLLELHYLRPWQKGVAPLKTYSLSIRIS